MVQLNFCAFSSLSIERKLIFVEGVRIKKDRQRGGANGAVSDTERGTGKQNCNSHK